MYFSKSLVVASLANSALSATLMPGKEDEEETEEEEPEELTAAKALLVAWVADAAAVAVAAVAAGAGAEAVSAVVVVEATMLILFSKRKSERSLNWSGVLFAVVAGVLTEA